GRRPSHHRHHRIADRRRRRRRARRAGDRRLRSRARAPRARRKRTVAGRAHAGDEGPPHREGRDCDRWLQPRRAAADERRRAVDGERLARAMQSVATVTGRAPTTLTSAVIASIVGYATDVAAISEEHGLSQRALEIARPFGFPVTNSMVVTWIVAAGLIVFT